MEEEQLSSLQEETLVFARLLVGTTIENIESVDALIKEHLEHWDFNRLSKVELAILRISTASLMFHEAIPASVTIDEAVNISKNFASDDSYKFINGVLDGIRKELDSDVS